MDSGVILAWTVKRLGARTRGNCAGTLFADRVTEARATVTWEMVMRVFLGATLIGAAFGIAACGPGAGSLPTGAVRGSGQSTLMDQTFAGKNACNPKNHDRPFVIEWDATDMSSFEARAASDVVFVRYEGCEIRVIEGCSNDSIRGAFGAYKPVLWTSGSLEKIDIGNAAELAAKLPLGVSSLGARVQGGEKFHMEYFVSGTRHATREGVYKSDLAAVPACREATHFVYAYNLGAFALGSSSSLDVTASASVFGFGAEGHKGSSAKAEKQGGKLATCSSESAKELSTCRVPVRLTLREVRDGDNPDLAAAHAKESDESLNLAGKVAQENKSTKDAEAHLDAVRAKLTARDGKGCLHELDLHDRADTRPGVASTDPATKLASVRAQCLMLAGQCEAGAKLARQWYENIATVNPDQGAKTLLSHFCEGPLPDDQALERAKAQLSGAQMRTAAQCKASYAEMERISQKLKGAKGEAAVRLTTGYGGSLYPRCLVKAGDCEGAWAAYRAAHRAILPKLSDADFEKLVPKLHSDFDQQNAECAK